MDPSRRERVLPWSRDTATDTLPSLDTNTTSRPAHPTVAHLFINNTSVMSKSKDWTTVLDPVSRCGSCVYHVPTNVGKAAQSLLSRVPASTHQEIQSAVDAAQAAQEEWNSLGFFDRRDYLFKFASVLKDMAPAIVRQQNQRPDTSDQMILADGPWIDSMPPS